MKFLPIKLLLLGNIYVILEFVLGLFDFYNIDIEILLMQIPTFRQIHPAFRGEVIRVLFLIEIISTIILFMSHIALNEVPTNFGRKLSLLGKSIMYYMGMSLAIVLISISISANTAIIVLLLFVPLVIFYDIIIRTFLDLNPHRTDEKEIQLSLIMIVLSFGIFFVFNFVLGIVGHIISVYPFLFEISAGISVLIILLSMAMIILKIEQMENLYIFVNSPDQDAVLYSKLESEPLIRRVN